MNWGKKNVFHDEMRFQPNYNDAAAGVGGAGGGFGRGRGQKGSPGPQVRISIFCEGKKTKFY